MLKHEDAPQAAPQTPPAAKVRVTPEELAAAVTALQIRKEGQPGTIAIGDAVEELGLDVTPEEVLAEVQARRQAKPKQLRSRAWDRAVLALGLGGIALWGSFCLMPTYPFEDASTISSNMTTVTGVPSGETASTRIKVAPNLMVGDASGKVMMLSEAKDNQPVRCTLVNSSTPEFIQYFPNDSGDSWTLIKHGDKLYVRGWILRLSPRVVRQYGVDVSRSRDANFVVPVTLPLKGFIVSPEVGSNAEFHAVNVSFDQHAYEKW